MEILDPLAREFLERYFENGPGHESFYLAGGTALSLADFQHRRSDDLDLFSRDLAAVMRHAEDLPRWGATLGFRIERDFSVGSEYFRRFRRLEPGGQVKIEMISEVGPFLGDVREIGGIRFENRRTLFAAKIATLATRREPKDLVDCYFIFRFSGQDRAGLVSDAMAKQGGMDPELIADALSAFSEGAGVRDYLRRYMIRSVSESELLEFCHEEAAAILALDR